RVISYYSTFPVKWGECRKHNKELPSLFGYHLCFNQIMLCRQTLGAVAKNISTVSYTPEPNAPPFPSYILLVRTLHIHLQSIRCDIVIRPFTPLSGSSRLK